MSKPPSLVVLDVNETLSDLTPMGDRFADLGLRPELAGTWFAATLRDGMALAVGGTAAPFADIAGHVLRGLLPPDADADAAVRHVLGGFLALPVHPDVGPGLTALGALGIEVVTLSNGAAAVAEGLLDRAGLRDRVAHVLTVEDAGVWKPAAAAYAHALEVTGTAAADAMLVAVHPWDVDGARRAGLRGGWLNRAGAGYPGHFLAPDVEATSLVGLAAALG